MSAETAQIWAPPADQQGMALPRPNAAQLTDGVHVKLIGTDWTITEVLRTVGEAGEKCLIDLVRDQKADYVALRGTPRNMLAVIDQLPVAPDDLVRIRRKYADEIRAQRTSAELG
jgi:hypothetical protein